ncbi:hypothetical protein ACQPZF_12815 [Actinosynnema sp. CS-041913]|uniref:hypothetical protein n=1 Tax=Actinosynnema sp. CS-041913 TaxID=3239917 RepID=UPI003D8EE180
MAHFGSPGEEEPYVPEIFTGKVEFRNTNGDTIFTFDPDSSFVQITHKTPGGFQVMQLTNTGSLSLWGPGDDHGARLDGSLGDLFLGGSGKAGTVHLRDPAKKDVITLDATSAAVIVGATGNEGDIVVRDDTGTNVIHLDAGNAVLSVGAKGNEGDIIVRDNAGNAVIQLDGGSGDIILSNADCAEDFDLRGGAGDAEAGTVMVLSEGGGVIPSELPYDRKVAGVISGAGGVRPGIVLGRQPSESPRCPLALVGKVYCQADASYGPIELGDMLTTSPTRGHAMRAADPRRSFGAVLGKALGGLSSGRGLVPVLVALQ